MELECYPYASGQDDDAVCLWMRLGPYGVLLDCGLEDPHPVLVGMTEGRPLNAIVCSHARPDRARGLRSLQLALPNRPIYTSEVSAKLLPLNWPRQNRIPQFRALEWQMPIEIAPDLWLELIPAGHLPGAAVTQLTYTGQTAKNAHRLRVTYASNFLISNSRLTSGLDLESLHGSRPDVAIVSGRYGTARYERRRSQENEIAAQIEGWLERGHTIVMPVPALGLAQELLAMFRAHHHFTGRDLDIWVDRGIAEVCDLYLEQLEAFPQSVQNFARHQPLFWDDRVRPRVHRLEDTAIEPLKKLAQAPSLILVDETADLTPFIDPSLKPVLLCSDTSDAIRADLLPLPDVPCEIYHLSEHCDIAGTTQLVHNLRPQHLMFVDGSTSYLADLTNLNELYDRYQVHCPQTYQPIAFPLKPFSGIKAALPATRYEGEVEEGRNRATISLPPQLQKDPRWQKLADTGVIEVRWQGEDLLVRGVVASELLEAVQPRIPLDVACCANCIYCRGQQCRNPKSPLADRRVSPDGYCMVFEAVESEF
ncbi:MAG: MBL fold metallo-hydrolase [Geitlerinemataceae cyanobacterium]